MWFGSLVALGGVLARGSVGLNTSDIAFASTMYKRRVLPGHLHLTSFLTALPEILGGCFCLSPHIADGCYSNVTIHGICQRITDFAIAH